LAADVTPSLDRLAAEGVVFEHAVSPAPLTLPSHASLFTSKYPPAHAVRDNGGFFLDERETTLAEHLKACGLKTGGFVGAYLLDRHWGIAQGFDTYYDNFDLAKFDTPSLGDVERPAKRGDRSGARVARSLEGVPVLRLDSLLRRALAVRAARALAHAVRH
jgi:arylsulfatase A-like enzyme